MVSASKLISTFLVAAVLVASVTVRPPRERVPAQELVRLVLAVTLLYLAGGTALLWHRTTLAAIVLGVGLTLCALALWLARGAPPPPPEDPPADEKPPSDPQPPRDFDWCFYEEQLRDPVA